MHKRMFPAANAKELMERVNAALVSELADMLSRVKADASAMELLSRLEVRMNLYEEDGNTLKAVPSVEACIPDWDDSPTFAYISLDDFFAQEIVLDHPRYLSHAHDLSGAIALAASVTERLPISRRLAGIRACLVRALRLIDTIYDPETVDDDD